jgi:hypothetical protein
MAGTPLTWILLVILYSANGPHPIGITNVPGYTSQIDCQTAQNEVRKQFSDPLLLIQTACIPGSWGEAKPH